MIWVDSLGGPLAVVAESELWHWQPDEHPGHIGDELVEVIRFGHASHALILGDQPATTTFIPSISAFVRWIYADHHTAVQALLEGALDDVEWTEGPIFDVTGPLVLFDAGESGLDVVPEELEEQYGDSREGFDALRFDIAPGLYRVRYADVHPDERTCFAVCRLVPLEN